MDVIFLRSRELNWEENYQRATDVLGNCIKVVDGTAAKSIKNAYDIMIEHVETEYFMMIEADNYVLPNIKNFLDIRKPVKFWTSNKFGVSYEHGAIKIMNTAVTKQQLKLNAHIYDNFEVSANLYLESIHEIVSEHRFDFSERNEWITVAKELIKLYYWAHDDFLDRWLAHERPRKIFEDITPILESASFNSLFNSILPSLGKYYDDVIYKA